MTPTAIIALARDLIILVALGLLIYLLISYGKDLVKVNDMKAVTAQLQRNTQQQAQWRKEQADADAQHDLDLAAVTNTIGANQRPVYILRGPPNTCVVPAVPGKTGGDNPKGGRADQGPGGDSRAAINALELKYEAAFADCRRLDQGWPK